MASPSYASIGSAADVDTADGRPYPTDGALEHLGGAIMQELLDVILGTPLEDHSVIAEGLLGGLHTAAQRIEREADKARDEINRGVRDFDGSEVADTDLQEATAKAHACDNALAAVETIRDAAAAVYTVATGEVWSPWKGYIRASPATAAMIDAKDALRSAKAARHAATNPSAVIVAFRASPHAVSALDASRIFDALNWARETYPTMALATTGLKGAEKIAMRWAQQKRVAIILAKADFDRHGRAAPFRANDAIMALDPVHVFTLPKSLEAAESDETGPFGPALNLGQEATKRGIPHIVVRVRS